MKEQTVCSCGVLLTSLSRSCGKRVVYECCRCNLSYNPEEHPSLLENEKRVIFAISKIEPKIEQKRIIFESKAGGFDPIEDYRRIQKERAQKEATKTKEEVPLVCEEFPFKDTKSLMSSGKIFFSYYYWPENRKFQDHEKISLRHKIWNMKNGVLNDVEEYCNNISEKIRTDLELVICVVPSHEKGLKQTGIRNVAKILCSRNKNLIDGNECLIRNKTLEKKHKGGSRSQTIEEESLTVQKEDIFKDKIVVLLDDITTSGTSMNAAIKKLELNGARKIYGLAIAKTC